MRFDFIFMLITIVLKVFANDDYVYLILELCRGGELLDAILRRKHFAEQDASSIFATICNAVQYLHSQQVYCNCITRVL